MEKRKRDTMVNFITYRLLPVFIFLAWLQYGHGQKQITAAEYFIDADPGVGLGSALSIMPGDSIDEDFIIPVTGYPAGFHLLAFRTKDSDGYWNVASARLFYINPNSIPFPPLDTVQNYLVEAEYFFNTDPGEGNGEQTWLPIGSNINIARTFNINVLPQGAHKVCFRVKQFNGEWSSVRSIDFTITTPSCNLAQAAFTSNTVNAGSATSLTNTSTNLENNATYEWDIMANGSVEYTNQNAMHTFSAPGTYDVKLKVINGSPACTTSVIKPVIAGPVLSKNITYTGSTSICSGDSINLTAPAGSNWVWNDGVTGQNRKAWTTGIYQVRYLDANAQLALSNPLSVIVNPSLIIEKDSANDVNGLGVGMARIMAAGGSSYVYDYNWSNGDSLPFIFDLNAGSYTCTVTDGSCPEIINFQLSNLILGNTGIVAAEYFIGQTDPGPGNGISFLNGIRGDSLDNYFGIDTSLLDNGINKVHFRVKHASGFWSCINYLYIYLDNIPLPQQAGNLNKLEYYFDADPGINHGNGSYINPSQNSFNDDHLVNFSGLGPGLHRLTVRFRNEAMNWGIEKSVAVIIDIPIAAPDTTQWPLICAEYFFDTDPGEGKGLPWNFNVNNAINLKRIAQAANLSLGSHKLAIRVKNLQGDWSLPKAINFDVVAPPCTLPVANFTHNLVNANQAMTLTNTSQNAGMGASYAWDILADGTTEYTTLDAQHTFTTPGIYDIALKVSLAPNCQSTIIKRVEVGPYLADTIQYAGAAVLCEGDSLALFAPAGSNYLWSTGQRTPSIFAATTGLYRVAYTDNNGTRKLSNELSIQVFPALTTAVTISPANTGMQNGSAYISATGGSNYIHNYLWSGGQSTPAIVNVAAGSYIVTISDPHCPAILNINIGSIPIHAEGLLAAEFFTGSDPGPGNGTNVNITRDDEIDSYFSLNLNGYPIGVHYLYFRVKSALGFWSIAQPLIVVITDPGTVPSEKPLIVAAQYFFDEDPGVENSLFFSGVVQDSTLNDSLLADFSQLTTGLHKMYVRVKDDEGKWSPSFPISILIDAQLPAPDTNDYPLVKAEFFMGQDPGEGKGTSFPLSGKMNINELIATSLDTLAPGNYTAYLRVMNLQREWSIVKPFSFSVFQTSACQQPQADFSYMPAAAGMSMSLQNESANADPGALYQWDIDLDDTTDYSTENISHTFNTPGIYRVRLKVLNNFICYSSVIKEVVVGPYHRDTLLLSGPATQCGGDSLIIYAPPGSNHLWNNGATGDSLIVTSGGIFQVFYTDLNGNNRLSNEVSITFNPAINVYAEVSPANMGMSNGSANIFVNGGNTYFYDYAWSNGAMVSMQDSLTAGTYMVTVSDEACEEVLSIQVGSISPPGEVITRAEYFIGFTDPGPGQGEPVQVTYANEINAFFSFRLDSLDPGLYTMFFRTKKSNGFWSSVQPLQVVISDTTTLQPQPKPNLISIEYFFGTTDPGEDLGLPWTSITVDTTLSDTIPISVASLSSGQNKVYLRVKNSEGQYSIVKGGTFQICNQPATPAIIPDSTICEDTEIVLTSMSSTPGVTYLWQGPNNFTSTIQNPLLENVGADNEGLYKVFAVLNGNCFSPSNEMQLDVNLLPGNAGTILSTITECTASTVFFVPLINNAVNYQWTFPNGVNYLAGNNTNNIAVSFNGFAGAFDLRVRATNACGIGEYSTALPVNTCFCDDVIALGDVGLGSIRNAIGCADPTDTIYIDPSFLGQEFEVSYDRLLINKNITIQPPSGSNIRSVHSGNRQNDVVVFTNQTGGAVFEVGAGNTLVLNMVDIYIGNQIGALGIINHGTVDMTDTRLIKTAGSNTSHIQNQTGASLIVNAGCQLKVE
ncbi:MAG: PKD domain-containing protein [Saprospiraceae bacterium]|nr:PKD domain-containing protein [Saprospiraceae bacterium]